jgi:hypothetical protein
MHRVCSSLVAAALVAAVAAPAVAQEAAPTVLRASLSGMNENNPAGDPDGTGSARITLNPSRGRVCYRFTLRQIGTVDAGHIHKGGPSTNGPVSVPLFAKATQQPSGCVNASKSLVRAIARHPRRYYVNVHNSTFPAGAARGQLHK